MTPVSHAAHAAHAAGICVLPPKQDGSKAPDAASWTEYQRRRPTEDQITRWYSIPDRSGIGYVCGHISGGLEVLDFDDGGSAWEPFQQLVEDNGLGDLWKRVTNGYLERTPSGGYHVPFRSPHATGATKLAQRPKRPEEKKHDRDHWQTLIETKGEGGYVVAAPTNGAVHPDGGCYELLNGGVDSIASIAAEERETLLALARMLDEKPRPVYGAESTTSSSSRKGDVKRPGDDYTAKTTWEKLLPNYGWREATRRGKTMHWTRPGKGEGVSATTNYEGNDLLWVFSSSTNLDTERSYDRFGFYAAMEHNGNFREAARALAAKGYGTPAETSTDEGSDHAERPSAPWSERRELPDITPPVPTLLAAMVPEPLRPWLVDAADRIKVPLEMPTVSALGAVGCVVGRQVGIRPSEYDEFTTIPNHWALVVARSGHMKTDSIKEGFRPVGKLIAEARKVHEEDVLSMEGRAARIEAELKAIKRRMDVAAKGEPPKEGQPVENLEALETEFVNKSKELKEAVSHERRYYTQDPTVEKMGELLQKNPRGMTILRDELSGWLQTLGKPGREGDREFYLEGWNGTGSYTVDRIGRGTIHIPAHTISIVGGIQPGKLQPLLDSAINGGSGDDGTMQRFQLLVWPDRLPEWSKPTGVGDLEAKSRADAVYAWLDTIDAGLVGADSADISYLRYSPGAQAFADTWRDTLEHRLRSGKLDDTPAYASHLAKYRSLLPSLALTFYLIDLAAGMRGVTKGAVGEQYVRLAADWCGFLEVHARKLYAAEIQAGVSAAHALASKIQAGAVFDGQSVRDLYRAQWAGLRTPDLVLAGLTDLTDLGWLRVDTEHPSGGGRPSQIIRLHPELADPPDPRSETTGTPGESEDTHDA